MIQLEHINLVVKNIPEMLKFYQTAFPHWYVRDEGEGTWSGKHRNWLHFGDEYQYIAMSDHGEGGEPRVGRPSSWTSAFCLCDQQRRCHHQKTDRCRLPNCPTWG